MAPGTPERFGPYSLHAVLGRGGMGEVYRAYDTVKERWVALKRLHRGMTGGQEFEARFRRESKVVARLREAHVIPIHDYGEIDGHLFLDMRLVDGADLATLIERGPLAPDRAIHIVEQVSAALDAAHADGLVHRDVKPSNVLVAPDDFAYLVDFGIVHSDVETGLTASDATVGTLAYMAPERFTGDRVDHRADVYSLGCVLYEALTGERPFPADAGATQMYAHIAKPPPRASDHGAPAALDAVVARALAKAPGDRFASAGALAAAARDALRPASPAVPATESAPPRPVDSWTTVPTHADARSARHRTGHGRSIRRLVLALTVVAATVAVAVGVLLHGELTPSPTPSPTTTVAPPPPSAATSAPVSAVPIPVPTTGGVPAGTAGGTTVKVPVRVYNNSTIIGLAARAASDFRADGWTVANDPVHDSASNYTEGVIVTSTVYYRPGTSEQAAATALGQEFGLRVEPRFAGIAQADPGLIVIVTSDYQKR